MPFYYPISPIFGTTQSFTLDQVVIAQWLARRLATGEVDNFFLLVSHLRPDQINDDQDEGDLTILLS